MRLCTHPDCKTEAGCRGACHATIQKALLADYTDEEIAAEHRSRALRRLAVGAPCIEDRIPVSQQEQAITHGILDLNDPEVRKRFESDVHIDWTTSSLRHP